MSKLMLYLVVEDMSYFNWLQSTAASGCA